MHDGILLQQVPVPVLLLNSPNLSLHYYFSLNKFERFLLLIFINLLCLITSHFLITKYLTLYVWCKEKLGVDNRLELKGLNSNICSLSRIVEQCATYNYLTKKAKDSGSCNVQCNFADLILETKIWTRDKFEHIHLPIIQLLSLYTHFKNT